MAISNPELLGDINSTITCAGTPFILNGDSLRTVQDHLRSTPFETEHQQFFVDLIEAHGTVRIPSEYVAELRDLLS